MKELLINQCINVTTNLMERPLFKIFKDRLYFEYIYPQNKIKKSCFIDLNSILSKLQSNSYETKEEWIADLSTIWNFIKSIQDEFILKTIGQEFERTSKKLINSIGESKEDITKYKISKLLKRLNNLSKAVVM